MEKAVLSLAVQCAQAREDFAHSAENRLRGAERQLTFRVSKCEDGGEFSQKRAHSDVPSVDAHRDGYAAAVTIQAEVMAKASRTLIALHEGLHDDVRQTLATTTATRNGTPSASAATASATARSSTMSSPFACASRPTPSRRGALVLSISITRMMIRPPHCHPMMRLRMRIIEE
jgi:hypothetical protein